jgi:hypothetical protein
MLVSLALRTHTLRSASSSPSEQILRAVHVAKRSGSDVASRNDHHITICPRRPARGGARSGKTRFFGSKRLQADRYASDFKKLADEVLGPLGATVPDGFDDAKVRTIFENAATLKFEQSGFEEG